MWEQAAVILAGAASAAYFAYQVAVRLKAMGGAAGALPTDRLGERMGRLFSEVLLQRRVISGRPVAGLLHGLVMWGFLAFGWVSIEHLTQGLIGLDRAQTDASWYGGFAALWAAAVLVGILGLALRRFVLRPPALGSPSAGSAVVAVMIVALMATYLAGWRLLEPASELWRANWWLHTLTLLGMLWVIPHSKHLHLVLGPAAIFFRHGPTTSPTRPLNEDDDDDLGLVHVADLRKKDILDVNACVECGRCTDVCPAHAVGGSLDPKQVILQLQRGLLAADLPREAKLAGTSQDVESGKAWVDEVDLFQCLSCGACEQACPVGIEHVGAKILDLRRGLVSEGRTHDDKLAEMFRIMERAPHNAWGAPQETRRKLLDTRTFPVFDGSQEWLFWLGCGCNYDPHGNDVARAMQKLLDAAGLSWGVLANETCCGETARRAGNEYLYMELSSKVLEQFESTGVKNIVTCDPHCCRMFDVDYRQEEGFAELGVRVVHHTELLEELLPSIGAAPIDEQVVYHDPCYLARGRGVVDQPRRALESAGVEVSEPRRSGAGSFCCGAGGAQLFLADDSSDGDRVNHQRFAELIETGQSTVAVACPYCAIMLKDAAGHASRPDVRIVDVAQLLAQRLPS